MMEVDAGRDASIGEEADKNRRRSEWISNVLTVR